jgi:hypothetical protein
MFSLSWLKTVAIARERVETIIDKARFISGIWRLLNENKLNHGSGGRYFQSVLNRKTGM